MVSFAEMFGEQNMYEGPAVWRWVPCDTAAPTETLGACGDAVLTVSSGYVSWPFPNNKIAQNPLAAMCHYRDSHSTERLCVCGEPENALAHHRTDGPCYYPDPPASTAKPAPAGIGYVRAIGDRSKIGA